MQWDNSIKFAVGNETYIDKMKACRSMPIFSPLVCSFFSSLSKTLLSIREAKKYADVITFAFWCRKSSVEEMKKRYTNENLSLGRGIVFHIAPSNVAMNFAYSFAAGLLSGNANIVRLPSKKFAQVDLVCDAIKDLLETEFMELLPYIVMLQYGHNKIYNDYFSKICDTRVIWGGDKTIQEIRQSELSARSTEITFADRFSIAIINADEYNKVSDKRIIAKDFYNDTYLSDQNACTSPRILIWYGNEIERAQSDFWDSLYKLVNDNYKLMPIQSVEKFLTVCLLSVNNYVKNIKMKDNYIIRIECNYLDEKLMEYEYNSGIFLEFNVKCLKEILPICSKKLQTLAYYGFDKKIFREFMCDYQVEGIDRFSLIGKTMNFALVWDGYDLIKALSRTIQI